MKVYSHYYGASAANGIGTQAKSPQLDAAALDGALNELSSLHALSTRDGASEMLMYLVSKGSYGILGLSYIESPASSGYNRSAPCGLQYVVSMDELRQSAAELGRTLNQVNFRKPASARPAPENAIPVNAGGYYYRSSPAVLACVLEAMLLALNPGSGKPALIALPQSKNSEYSTARYTVSELVGCLPEQLRGEVRFFTDLPASDDNADPTAAFNLAVRLGANVIFCSGESYQRLKGKVSVFDADMENPARAGEFSSFVAYSPEPAKALLRVEQSLEGVLSLETLNAAARKVSSGEAESFESLNEKLRFSKNENKELKKTIGSLKDDVNKLSGENEALRAKLDKLKAQSSGKKKSIMPDKRFWFMAIPALLLLLAAAVIITMLLASPSKDSAPAPEAPAETQLPDETEAQDEDQPGDTGEDADETPSDDTGDKTGEDGESGDAETDEPDADKTSGEEKTKDDTSATDGDESENAGNDAGTGDEAVATAGPGNGDEGEGTETHEGGDPETGSANAGDSDKSE